MNIGPPPVTPPPRPSTAAMVRGDSPDTPPGGSPPFGDVVNGRPAGPGIGGAAGLPLPTVRPAEQAAFAAQTFIGDAAVRFDARPIVAPSAEPLPATAAACLADRQAAVTPAMPSDAADPAALGALVQGLARQLAAAPSDDRAALPIGRTIRFGPAPAAASAAGATPAAMPAPPNNRRGLPAARAGALGSPPATTPVRAALDRGPSARIAASGDEIRILIRHVALSAEDTAMLERIAREALGASPLADRTVRVFGRRR